MLTPGLGWNRSQAGGRSCSLEGGCRGHGPEATTVVDNRQSTIGIAVRAPARVAEDIASAVFGTDWASNVIANDEAQSRGATLAGQAGALGESGRDYIATDLTGE